MVSVYDVEPDWEETARRLKAFMRYVGLNDDDAAAALNISKGTYYRMIGTKGKERTVPTWRQLIDLSETHELVGWFTADLRRLPEIVTEPLVSQRGGAAAGARTSIAQRQTERMKEERQHRGGEQPPRTEQDDETGTGQ